MVNSIRFRLTIWFVGVLAVVILLFSAGSYVAVTRMIAREADQRLMDASRSFEVAVNAESAEQNTPAPSEESIREAVGETRSQDYSITVIGRGGMIVASSSDIELPDDFPDGFSDATIAGTSYRLYVSHLSTISGDARVVLSRSRQEQLNTAATFRAVLIIAIILAVLLASLGGYILSRKSLAPMVEIGKQAARIGSSNLSQRLTTRHPDDELGQLVGVFNELLGRLDEAFDQQRRFMADASHELRTPLAVILGESEVTLSRDGRPADDYMASLKIVHDQSRRLGSIVDDLFILARADAGQLGGRLDDGYLDEIVSSAVSSIRVLANKKGVAVDILCDSEMPMHGNEWLLERMFLNILDNAVKYTLSGGEIHVDGKAEGEWYVFEVRDTGVGIPKEKQGLIFDRFYRADEARSGGDAAGAGLGLSIAQWIAGLHRGSVALVRSDASGSTFEIRLPAARSRQVNGSSEVGS